MAENTRSDIQTYKLSYLIENTVASLRTNVLCEKAAQIQKAVATNVKFFLSKVAEEEPLFRISELLQVGSYAEGTKISQPDEFDFLAVMGELSEPGAIVVDNNPENIKGHTNLPKSGYVTVVIADDNLKTRWEKYCEYGLLQCFQNAYHRVRFGNIFIKVIRKLYKTNVSSKKQGSFITCSSTEIDFLDCMRGMPPVDDISLNLRRVEFRTPNVLIDFELDGQLIGVDLSPAIRYHKIEDCFKADNCAGTVLSEAILNRKSLLLVASRDVDFRVTVTETEVQYIRCVMKQEHKVIYMFLKHANNTFTEKNKGWNPFSSYMLKNICLTHDINCKKDKITVASCLEKVIEELSACCSKFEMASAVNSKLNLFVKTYMGHLEELEFREYLIGAVKNVCQQSTDVDCVEKFKDVLNSQFDQTVERFNAMREEKYFRHRDDYQIPDMDFYKQHYAHLYTSK